MKIRSRTIFMLVVIALSSLALAVAANPVLLWQTRAELQQPESVIYDAQRGILYVSNVNGPPTEKNGEGFLSRVTLDGVIADLKWLDGLNGPKGMAILGDSLYVADIDQLVEIDIASGTVANRYVAADAVFLNDVAGRPRWFHLRIRHDDRYHHATQRRGNSKNGCKVRICSRPNGLTISGDDLIVGAWGIRSEGFATEVPGHLLVVSLEDKSIRNFADGSPMGNLDGVESDGQGGYYLTDWMLGSLLHVDADGKVTQLLDLNMGSADLGVILDKGIVLIPMMNDNIVSAYSFP